MEEKRIRIALIVNFYSIDYFVEFAKSMDAFCSNHNCCVSVFTIGDLGTMYSKYGYQQRATAALITKNNFDGVIILSSFQATTISHQELHDYIMSFAPLPVVSVGVAFPDIPSILVDDKPGMREIMVHLVTKHHCKKIALLGVKGNSEEARVRTEAYKEVMAEYNIPYTEDDIIYGQFTYGNASRALEEYVKKHGSFDYDAVVALNDDMAFAANDFCRLQGIPRDKICITGFDDVMRSSYSTPTFSTVNQQVEKQGELAMRTICDVVLGREVPNSQTITCKAYFRQSCGCVSADDFVTNSYTSDGVRIDNKSKKAKYYAAEWLEKKCQLVRIQGYHDSTDGSYTLEELRTRMNEDLKKFNIKSAAFCLYENPVEMEDFRYFPMPEKAYVYSAFDNGVDVVVKKNNENITFKPTETMLPEGMFADSKAMVFVLATYHRNRQFGYFLFKPGDYDLVIYDLFAMILFSEIDSAYFITQEQEAQKKLDNISQTDDLTGVLNRRGFLSIGEKAVDVAVSTNRSGVVIFCDMDGLKKINDTYGHSAGDRAIRGEAEVLKAVFSDNDVIGRFGGDEFAVVAPGGGIGRPQQLKKHIDSACSEWNKKNHEPFTLSLSIGCAEFSPANHTFSSLMKEADANQYEEKKKKYADRKE